MSTEVDPSQFDLGDEKNKFSDFFVFQKVLGNGSFGVVVSAFQKPHMKECAVKIIVKKSLKNKNLENLSKESSILQQMNHPNVVRFVAINESETRIFIVMELVRGGMLKALLQDRNQKGKPLSDEEAATIMRSIFSGLQYIHGKDIVHRDLKPENILLDDPNDLTSIKICDFGLSAQYNLATCTRSFLDKCGTDIYMAPELWKKKRYSKPVDMYSCGIILYMLLSGGKHPLYKQGDNHESYWKKLEGAQWPMLPNFNKFSKNLFLKCVHEEPSFRYTVEQVQAHPWITRRLDEDFPLTSSEKLAAFSHSEILSRIMKGMYLMYSLPKLNTQQQQADSQTSENENDQKEAAKSEGSSKASSSNEIDNNTTIPTEQESPMLLDVETSKLRLEHLSSFSRKDTLTPPPDLMLTRKTSPSVSTQESNIKINERRLTGMTAKDVSGIGSLAELESTHGSNPSSMMDEKKLDTTKQAIESSLHVADTTRPLEKDSSRKEIPMRMLWAPDRAATALVNVPTNSTKKRRDLKSNKLSGKFLSGQIMQTKGNSDRMDSLGEMIRDGKAGLKDKDMNRNIGTINDIRFELQKNSTRIVKTKPETDNIFYVRYDSNNEKSDRKESDTTKNKEGAGGRRARKAALDTGPLPHLAKMKPRQTSLPAKKKGTGKEKPLLSVPDVQKSGGGKGPQSMILDANTTIIEKNEEKRSETPFRSIFEEKRMKTQQDVSRRNASLIATFKTPIKEDKDFITGLPSIRQETRKTKLNWVHSSEKVLPQKTESKFPNTSGMLRPHAPAKLVKA